MDGTDVGGPGNGAKGGCMIWAVLAERGLFSQPQPRHRSANPLDGKTTDWRADCGRTARSVRRKGGANPIAPPYPYSPLTGFGIRRESPMCLRTPRAMKVREMLRQRSPEAAWKSGQSGVDLRVFAPLREIFSKEGRPNSKLEM